MFDFSPLGILVNVIVVLIAFTAHELAHAATAYALGDTSQKEQGNLSFNPLRHIELFGFVLAVLFGFGWAKPVMIHTDKLRHKNIAPVLVALVGPFANAVLAVIGFIGLAISYPYLNGTDFVSMLIFRFIVLNLGMFVFNLLPIPPLDGSVLVTEAFFKHRPDLVMRFNQIGSFALFGLFILQGIAGLNIIPIGAWILELYRFGLRVIGMV